MSASRLQQNLAIIRDEIADAALRSGRDPSSVRLVAVTKRRHPALVSLLADQGVLDFGENYPQELWDKAASVGPAGQTFRWHLIGHLQGNKAARTAPLVDMIHSVDSMKLLRGLDALAASMPDPPEVLLQVNVSGEVSKYGFAPESALEAAREVAALAHVPVVGFMTMAPLGTDNETARPTFRRLREFADRFAERAGRSFPHLSMGMSGDYVAAVEEGATLVRVGSALFEGVEP